MAPQRYASLDGMRGLFALLVVAIHASLVAPSFVLERDRGAAALLQFTWAGTLALMSFFVMSGFVLTLPFLDGAAKPRWLAYYPQRLLRLYPPVVAAVLLAAVIVVLFPRQPVPGGSDWLEVGHVHAFTKLADVANDIALIGPNEPGTFLSPLWSLRWEVYFSLLLPMYLFVARRFSRYAVLLALGSLTAVVLSGHIGANYARYLPVFALGSLMAARLDDLVALAARFDDGRWAGTGAATLLLATVGWWVPMSDALSAAAQDAAAATIVFACLTHPSVRRLCESTPAAFLGTISYSVYLVHELVIINLAFAFAITDPAVMVAVAVVPSLLAGWLFFLVVERPSHHLSRSAGRLITSAAARYPRAGAGAGAGASSETFHAPRWQVGDHD